MSVRIVSINAVTRIWTPLVRRDGLKAYIPCGERHDVGLSFDEDSRDLKIEVVFGLLMKVEC